MKTQNDTAKANIVKKFISRHKGKALIGVGIAPMAYLAWKKRGTIWENVKELKNRAFPKKTKQVEESSGDSISIEKSPTDSPLGLKLTDSRKTEMIHMVRFMLSKYDTNSFTIVYGRSRKQGYMGYYVRAGKEGSLFFGWSDEFENQYSLTPFWITLNPAATKTFREKNLTTYYDIYVNPKDDQSILISLPLKKMEDPQAVAGKIIELAGETLL